MFDCINLERWIGNDLQDEIFVYVIRFDEIKNHKTLIVNKLKITKYPFLQGSISSFINISIKKIKNL